MVDINSYVQQLQDLTHQHPLIALGIVLLLIAYIASNKWIKLFFNIVGALALLQGFGLTKTFVDFVKELIHEAATYISV